MTKVARVAVNGKPSCREALLEKIKRAKQKKPPTYDKVALEIRARRMIRDGVHHHDIVIALVKECGSPYSRANDLTQRVRKGLRRSETLSRQENRRTA